MTIEQEALVVTGEGKRVETRWYVQRAYDADRYDVYITRYTFKLDKDGNTESKHETPPKAEYLNLVHQWEEYGEGERIVPCMTLKGTFVHLLYQVGAFDQTGIEESLRSLCTRIVTSTLDVIKGGEEPDTPSDTNR